MEFYACLYWLVLFNIYGPRADSEDVDRIQFKLLFFKILQKRWESFLSQGRRIFVVGDLNIAPSAIDRCDAGPDFENNQFRRWFRSMLVESGGSFFDVFRAKHPERREAYTCWPSHTGAEQFNYGSRIDHMLCTGSCLHQKHDLESHNLLTCHVKDCDILIEYKRWKDGNTPRYRWKGEGLSIKLEGSDHAPVYMSLEDVPEIPQHSTPSLASRYLPMICGLQQTLVSMLMKRKVRDVSVSSSAQTTTVTSCSSKSVERSFNSCGESDMSPGGFCSPLNQESEGGSLKTQEDCRDLANEATCNTKVTSGSSKHINPLPGERINKKPRKSQFSQLSLRSFFQKSSKLSNDVHSSVTDTLIDEVDVPKSPHHSNKTPEADCPSSGTNPHEANTSECSQDRDLQDGNCSLDKEKNNVALLEWRRIQQLMENSIPICKGHQEPCVARVVKKPGPTFGRRFYVCARAEGPASNPEANCGYFKWASSKSRQK